MPGRSWRVDRSTSPRSRSAPPTRRPVWVGASCRRRSRTHRLLVDDAFTTAVARTVNRSLSLQGHIGVRGGPAPAGNWRRAITSVTNRPGAAGAQSGIRSGAQRRGVVRQMRSTSCPWYVADLGPRGHDLINLAIWKHTRRRSSACGDRSFLRNGHNLHGFGLQRAVRDWFLGRSVRWHTGRRYRDCGEEGIHPGVQEPVDLPGQVADAGRVGTGPESAAGAVLRGRSSRPPSARVVASEITSRLEQEPGASRGIIRSLHSPTWSA